MYAFFVESRTKIQFITQRISQNPQHIVSTILTGTLLLNFLVVAALFINAVLFQQTYLMQELVGTLVLLIYLAVAAFILKLRHYRVCAWMLLFFYSAVASAALAMWGIDIPLGLLMLSFVIFLSSVTLGSRYIIPVTVFCIGLILSVQTLTSMKIIQPDVTSLVTASGFGDALSYSTMFGIFAVIALIARHQTEGAISRAVTAEAHVQKEKQLLAVRLEERTQLLRESQALEMRQLYNFAELGQLTAIILHELANQLSILTIDIYDLKDSRRHADTIERAKESITNIDMMVDKVRMQLRASSTPVKFDALKVVRETIGETQERSKRSNITISLERASVRSFHVFGDPLRLSQILTIVINNAIDANLKYGRSEIDIIKRVSGDGLQIVVVDYCGGISEELLHSLFKPLQSTKENGLGIGLFIAKQIIETHFKGTITAASGVNRTEFTISLPAYHPSKPTRKLVA